MDEPFGALDEITRNKLDSDLLELWRTKKLTVIFVTHSIYEAVYLSTRVVVMAARPGRLIEGGASSTSPIRASRDVPRLHRRSPAMRSALQDSLLRASGAAPKGVDRP